MTATTRTLIHLRQRRPVAVATPAGHTPKPPRKATFAMTVTLAATALALIYAGLCYALPFGRCRLCRGTGTRRRLIARRLRTCRRCKGAGIRLRYGRRAANYLIRVQREGHSRRAR